LVVYLVLDLYYQLGMLYLQLSEI